MARRWDRGQCLPAGVAPRRPRVAPSRRASSLRCPGHRRPPGRSNRLEDERRHASRTGPAVVRGVREDQLVPGSGHRHVAEPAFLGEGRLGRRPAWRGPARSGSPSDSPRPVDGNRPATIPGRKTHRELQPLRLVDGQDGDRIEVRVELRRGRVVAGLDERLEMTGHEDGPIVRKDRRLGTDDLEEPSDVAEGFLGRDRVRCCEPGEHAASAQEPIQQLARRLLVGRLAIGLQVRDQAVTWRAISGPPAGSPAARRVHQDGPDGPVPSTRHVDDAGQILAAQAVELRGRERVDVDARLRISDDPEEGQQETDLRTAVQARGPRKSPRDRPPCSSARRIGSAWPFARTRIAWSRGVAPAAIRRPISAAIQSASPCLTRTLQGGAGSALTIGGRARRRLSMPVRTSSRSGSLNRIIRYAASRTGASER